jgi:hypothetical protein
VVPQGIRVSASAYHAACAEVVGAWQGPSPVTLHLADHILMVSGPCGRSSMAGIGHFAQVYHLQGNESLLLAAFEVDSPTGALELAHSGMKRTFQFKN